MKIMTLPGWQQDCTHWMQTSEALRAMGAPVHCIDLPGFGKEPYNKTYTNIPSIAAFVMNKLQDQQDQIILVGHSFGGRVAAYIAAKHPEMIRSLILIGSPNLYHPNIRSRIYTVCAKLTQPLHALVPKSIRKNMRSTDYQNVRGTEMEALFKNIIGEDQTHLLTQITIPTLILWGENDDAVPLTVAHEIHKIIHTSKLTILDNVGHNIHLEKPLLLASTIATYAKNL